MSQQINLFNPVFMKQRKYFSAVAMLEGLSLIALGSLLFFAYAKYQVMSLTAQLEKTSQRNTTEEKLLKVEKEAFSPQEAKKSLEEELKLIEVKLAAQEELIKSSGGDASGNITGYSEYMNAFARQTVNGLWLRGFSINEDATKINLNGSALSPELVPLYVRKLNKEEVMRGKLFDALQIWRSGKEGRYVEFSLRSESSGAEPK